MAWKIRSVATQSPASGDALACGTVGAVLTAVRSVVGLGGAKSSGCSVNRTAFTAAVIGLSAKLAKSDGVALEIEADTFERLFAFPATELGNVRRLFDLAARDTAGFESYAGEIARSLAGKPDLMRDIFDALLHIASADGVLHGGEDRFLAQVAAIFGYAPAEYKAMRAHFIQVDDDPFTILGMVRESTNAALKAQYLALVREHHPDALASKGLAVELRQIADRKLAIINAAWDAIAKERGL